LLDCYAGVLLTFLGGGQLAFTDGQISLKFPLDGLNHVGKIILTAGQFVRCLALNETPGYGDDSGLNFTTA